MTRAISLKDFLVDSIRPEQFDPYGPDAEMQRELQQQKLANRGNCALYCFISFVFGLPGLIVGVRAYEASSNCANTRDDCVNACTADWEARLESLRTSAERFSVSGQTEQAEACKTACEENLVRCVTPTYLMFGAVGMLACAFIWLYCLTGMFENVRDAAKKERERERLEGTEQKKKKLDAGKKKKGKKKGPDDVRAWEDSDSDSDGYSRSTEPTSPRSPTSPMSTASSVASAVKANLNPFRCLYNLLRLLYSWLVQPVVDIVYGYWLYLTLEGDDPTFTWMEVQCPYCDKLVEVRGVDQANLKVGFFQDGWGLQRAAQYCPNCKGMLSGIKS
jgi:hypothetical protein